MMRVPVVVRRADVHEGCVVPKCQHPEAQTVEDVDHASDAGKLAECHHAMAWGKKKHHFGAMRKHHFCEKSKVVLI